ncbi:MAG: hypothetical protein V3T22_01890 [Planctomycetota bacterium]
MSATGSVWACVSKGGGSHAVQVENGGDARTLHGSQLAGEWFAHDAQAIAAAFEHYHATVPPSASLPTGVGRLFEAWRERQGDAP